MVNEVVLVGGSTRIPKVQEMVQDFFDGKDLCKTINPDEAVAYGAAVLAANKTGKGSQMVKDLILLDVIPLSLGFETNGQLMTVVIPKNTPIPVTMESIGITIYDNQSSARFTVYQGERSRSTDNIYLGEFVLQNLPAAPRGVTKIKVRFNIDADGILNVSAKEPISDQENNIIITNGKRTRSSEETDKMVEDAKRYKLEDQEYKNKVRFYVALENYVYNMKTKMKDGNIRERLSQEDLRKMDDVVNEAMQWFGRNNVPETNVITAKKKELECIFNSIVGQFV